MLGNLPVNSWRDSRHTLNKSFTLNKLKLMVSIINEALNEFINIKKENKEKELNFYALYQNLILDTIGRTAFVADTQV